MTILESQRRYPWKICGRVVVAGEVQYPKVWCLVLVIKRFGNVLSEVREVRRGQVIVGKEEEFELEVLLNRGMEAMSYLGQV